MDTDSGFVVADQEERMLTITASGADGKPVVQNVKALSWPTVQEIATCFNTLNPYPTPAPILKQEDDNFEQGAQRPLYFYGISAKRYGLSTAEQPQSLSDMLECKESALAFFVNAPPNDQVEDDRPTALLSRQLYLKLFRGEPTGSLPLAQKPYVLLRRLSTAYLWRLFQQVNQGRPYAAQIKPFNFFCSVSAVGKLAQDYTLYTPHVEQAADVLGLPGVTLNGEEEIVGPVKKLGLYFDAYDLHPETPFNGPDNQPCSARTRGVLSRRRLQGSDVVFLGKKGDDLPPTNQARFTAEESVVYGSTHHDLLTALATLQDMTPQQQLDYSTHFEYPYLLRLDREEAVRSIVRRGFAEYVLQDAERFAVNLNCRDVNAYLEERTRLQEQFASRFAKARRSEIVRVTNCKAETSITSFRNGDFYRSLQVLRAWQKGKTVPRSAPTISLSPHTINKALRRLATPPSG
jgi:hypothetical protein